MKQMKLNKESDYPAESWKTMQTVLEEAKAAEAKESQEKVMMPEAKTDKDY